ncbi:hypothetical protein GCM10010342_55540 [Streptomyces anulatus]|nr:hypothetical protein GCM10010342_55540 [Streptomyces anulatus]
MRGISREVTAPMPTITTSVTPSSVRSMYAMKPIVPSSISTLLNDSTRPLERTVRRRVVSLVTRDWRSPGVSRSTAGTFNRMMRPTSWSRARRTTPSPVRDMR